MLLRGGPDGHRRWHDRQSSRQPRIKDGGRGPFHGTDFVSRELQKEKAADMNIMENVFNGLLVWALLVPSPARAEPRYSSSLPPSEYDVPYEGTLTIWRLQSEQAIREMCSRTPFPILALACSISPRGEKPKSWCYVFIVSDAVLKARGVSLAYALRHELGHCNDWPKDHPGGRKLPVDAAISPPKLPETTRWLPAYPPLHCITPDRTVEDCKKRQLNPAGAAHGGDPPGITILNTTPPTIVVVGNNGGDLFKFVDYWRRVAVAPDRVEIRGPCVSACAMVLARRQANCGRWAIASAAIDRPRGPTLDADIHPFVKELRDDRG
jgi:hypothetical protein